MDIPILSIVLENCCGYVTVNASLLSSIVALSDSKISTPTLFRLSDAPKQMMPWVAFP